MTHLTPAELKKFIPPAIPGEVITPGMVKLFQQAAKDLLKATDGRGMARKMFICYVLEDQRTEGNAVEVSAAKALVTARLKRSSLECWLGDKFPEAVGSFQGPNHTKWQALRLAWLDSMCQAVPTRHVHYDLIKQFAEDCTLTVQEYQYGCWVTERNDCGWYPDQTYRVIDLKVLEPGDTVEIEEEMYTVCTARWLIDTYNLRGLDAKNLTVYRPNTDTSFGVSYRIITSDANPTMTVKGTEASRKIFGG